MKIHADWNMIVDILRLGLPGLVFLLALLSYRLLEKEQQKKVPNAEILQSIGAYAKYTIFFAILTAAVPLLEVAVNRCFPAVSVPGDRIRVVKLVLIEPPATGSPLSHLVLKAPPVYGKDTSKIAFATSVSGYSVDSHGQTAIQLQVVVENLGTGKAYIAALPTRTDPQEWKKKSPSVKPEEVSSLLGDTPGTTIFAGVLVDPLKDLGQGNCQLRVVARDLLNSTFSETSRSIDVVDGDRIPKKPDSGEGK
jgi:hypothetical protein